MNVRFAEPCRDRPLRLEDPEERIRGLARRDGRTDQELACTCDKDIFVGFFFDGTNNNKYRDTPNFAQSNVARLYEVYPGSNAGQTAPTFRDRIKPDGGTEKRPVFADASYKAASIPPGDEAYYRKVYVPGLGTPFPDACDTGTGMQKTGGLAAALLGQARLDWALLQLVNQVHAAIFGAPIAGSIKMDALYERKAVKPGDASLSDRLLHALTQSSLPARVVEEAVDKYWAEYARSAGIYSAQSFDALLKTYFDKLAYALKARGDVKPKMRKIRLSAFGFSRGATEARAWVNLLNDRWGNELAGIPLQIDFLGVFDTVASVGLAQACPPLRVLGEAPSGHYAWAEAGRLVVPPNVRRCVHLVAAHEIRGSFPIDSVCQGNQLPSNCKEIVYPGVHSDVGGGYPPNDQGRCLGDGAAGDQLKLSQVPLAQMYREALMAGVPLVPEAMMVADKKAYFAISPQLRKAFNAYVEATRTGQVPPTNGKGDPVFGAMFPTETQPRGELFRIMRHHYGIFLRWRKAMLGKGGVSELPGLKQNTLSSKFQDIEDFRGAENELRKEIAFLQSKDPEKFKVFDDALIDEIKSYLGMAEGVKKIKHPVTRTIGLIALGLDWDLKTSVHKVMEEKQLQWDTWLREEWFADDLGVPDAAAKLFEHHVHDSRAWFKPGMREDVKSMAPDDEDWFVYGGREKELKSRLSAGQPAAAPASAAGAPSQPTADTKPKVKPDPALKREGAPLVVGAREPYRMWGYVRHRKVYQGGSLKDPTYGHRQAVIEKEEAQRKAAQRKQERMSAELERHDKEVSAIKANNRRVLQDPALSEDAKKEHTAGAKAQLAREKAFHEQAVKQIESTLT